MCEYRIPTDLHLALSQALAVFTLYSLLFTYQLSRSFIGQPPHLRTSSHDGPLAKVAVRPRERGGDGVADMDGAADMDGVPDIDVKRESALGSAPLYFTITKDARRLAFPSLVCMKDVTRTCLARHPGVKLLQ